MQTASKDLPFDPMDPQRLRVYHAELEVWPRDKDTKLTLQELQAWVDDILARPWFRDAYPDIEALEIKDGRGSPWARVSLGKIHLPKRSRVLDVLVHEVLHHCLPGGAEWHGAVFCGLLLFFIGRLYDQKTKAKLRRAFRREDPPVVWDKRMARFGNLHREGKEGEK